MAYDITIERRIDALIADWDNLEKKKMLGGSSPGPCRKNERSRFHDHRSRRGAPMCARQLCALQLCALQLRTQ